MYRAEQEEQRHREANNTALLAIGVRKRKHDADNGPSAVCIKNQFKLRIKIIQFN